MKKFVAVFVVVLLASLSLSAEIYVKTKAHTDPMSMMGQTTPATDTVQEQWLGDGRMAMITTGQIIIIDMAKKKMLWITPASKSYLETALPLDYAKIMPEQMAAMAGMMQATVTVVPTNEKKKIGQWNCTAYTMNMTVMGMAMPMKVWATTDVPFDYAKYAGMMAEMAKGQMRLGDAAVAEMAKIKGFQVASEMNAEIMGAKIHTTSEVLEISQKDAPASIWTVPAGFTKRDKLTMEEVSKR
ncbi:MAG: DUF4412 domain-containing protein [Candidatus Aminicenantes bacterium]|nr:DUF4412 domain-containing protein [Candidatus Aminicenantes bacterium]